MVHTATIALAAFSTGAIIEVLHDELHLTTPFGSGCSFGAIVHQGSLPHAARFLRTIEEDRVALDFTLEVACRDGPLSLIFSGCKSDHDLIFIIGAREALSRESLVQELTAIVDHYSATRHSLEAPQRNIGLDLNLLLAATAHQLRNPLNGILAASQYLVEDAGSLLKPEHFTLLRSLESSSWSLFRAIDDSLDVSAIESGERRLDPAPTDILKLIGETLSLHRLSAERRNVQTDLTSAGYIPLISLDAAKISRVVDTLLTKCIQTSMPGGRIEVRVEIQGEEAIISIQSKKSFLSADLCRLLSNPRQQSNYALSRVKPGDLIAFRMVTMVVERHGGSIRVESDAEKGLTFIVVLPISAARARSF